MPFRAYIISRYADSTLEKTRRDFYKGALQENKVTAFELSKLMSWLPDIYE